MTFQELNLEESLLRALKEEGYETPTPIQTQSIPHSLRGRDLLACAQTGTGKTAAFALPILQRLHSEHLTRQQERPIKALILTPTRELAIQIEESFKAYGRHMRLRKLVIFGGVGQGPQVDALKKGVDILVATPGRLLDLMNQGFVNLKDIEIFVLDEADRMLDMGFIHDVRRICSKVPTNRQTLFFSATMPKAVAELAHTLCKDPARVDVDPTPVMRPKITQKLMFVDQRSKPDLLVHLLKDEPDAMVLVFSRTKHRADRIVKKLQQAKIRAGAIHSNKSQGARQRALADFADGRTRVLVATDIAARGIDVEGITHVINFDLSDEPENHVHRIGRTARAGASGVAISFCDREELKKLAAIEKIADTALMTDDSHPYHMSEGAKAYIAQVTAAPKSKTSRGGWPKPKRRGRGRSRRNGMR